MAIYLRRSALQSRLKALLSTRNLSFVRGGRNCNPDLAPKVPTLKDLTSRIAEKCEPFTKNGVEKDDKESNTELGSHSVSVAGANVDDRPVSVQNLSFVRDRNCNPDMVPNAPTLKDLASRITEKCEAFTKNGVEKDDKESNTELGSHSVSVAGANVDDKPVSVQKLSFVWDRNCNPDMVPNAPTLLASRITEKCEALTKNGVEKDDKESNTELGSYSVSVAGANVDDKPVSVQKLSFVWDRNCNPDMVPNAPTLKDLTSRITEKCESLTKNGVEKDDKESNTELGSHSVSVAGANVDDKPVSVQNLSFVRDRNCNPDMVPNAPTLIKDLTSRITEKCEAFTKNGVEKDDKESNTELGSHSVSVAGANVDDKPVSVQKLSFVWDRNCNPDMVPNAPTLKDLTSKDLTSRITEKCEALTKNGVEKDDKESNTELGSHSVSVAGADVDDKPVSVQNLSFVRDRNCNPDVAPKVLTLKDLTSRIAEKCESLTKNGVEKDDKESNTELGSHSVSVAGANVDDKSVSVQNLSFVRDRNCNPDMVPNAPTLKDLTSRITEKCEALTKNGVVKDNIEPNTELGSHSMNVAGKVDVSKWRKLDSRKLGIQKSKISPSSWAVLKILHGEGFDTYLVGGCVRDLILNKVPKDFDIITTASLQQIKKLFHRCLIIGTRFPICLVSIKGIPIEVSSFETSSKNSKRKEEPVPLHVSFGCDKKDLARWRNSLHRDFTINSLYYDPFVDKVYDYANAMMDLQSLKLRTVVPAHLSFEEDCARILRGLRIAARLGLSISEETDTAIRKLSSSVTSLAKARIMMEMNYMLSYGAAKPSLSLLRRFNLLEILLPFQAAYLNEHARKRSSRSSPMLMELFFHLDKLVSCDQPSDCNLWVGLLAFHTALVHKPQDTLVVWTFASVLYHRTWKEAVQFAREHSQAAKSFSPEIHKAHDVLSDTELANRVTEFSYFVQYCIGSLVDKDALFQSLCRYPGCQGSDMVFVSPNAGYNTSRLFSMLVDDVEANIQQGREGFKINYDLLKKGDYEETRFVLGKVITDTLKSGVSQAAKRRRVLPTTANPIQNQQPVVDAKPEEVAQNQQNKDEKVTYDTVVTRVSKWWNKLVRRETVTEEDQKACRNVDHGDGKENLNFSEDGILEKQEIVIVNEEPEKVNISEKEHQMVKKKKESQVKPDNITEETLEMVDNTLPSQVLEIEEGDKTKNEGGKKKKRDVTENGCQEVTKKRRKVKKEKDSSLEVVNNTLPGSVLENGQGVKKKRRKKPKQDDVTVIEEEAPKVKKKARRVKSDNLNVEMGNFQDSSPDGMVNSSESDEIPKKKVISKEKKLLKEPIEYHTQKFRKGGRTISEIVAMLQKRGKSSSEVLDVMKHKLPNSFEWVKEEEKDVENSDKKGSGTALSSLWNFQDSSPDGMVNNASPGSDGMVNSSESNKIPKKKVISKEKKLLKEPIEYHTQKLRRGGRTLSEIVAILEKRGNSSSEVLELKLPTSFEPGDSKKDDSDKKGSGTALSSLFR